MEKLKLIIPKIDPRHVPAMGSDAAGIKSWLDRLPVLNGKQGLASLLEGLKGLNRSLIDVRVRAQCIAWIQPEAARIVGIVHANLGGIPLPFKQEKRAILEQVWSLKNEIAYAYKLVLFQLLNSKQHDPNQIVQYIGRSLRTLTDLLCDHYLYYYAEPAQVWGEIHTLYLFAAHHRWNERRVELEGGQSQSVDEIYMEAVLLSAVIPYRLMRGEIGKVRALLKEWGHHCKFRIPGESWRPKDELFVDLSQDRPPGCKLHDAQLNRAAIRILDVGALKNQFQAEQGRGLQADTKLARLSERKRRELLARLSHGWGGRAIRATDRVPVSKDLAVVVGMAACIQMLTSRKSGGVTLEKEISEISFASLSLLPMDSQPLHATTYSSAGFKTKPTPTTFQAKDPERDIWARSSAIQGPVEIEEGRDIMVQKEDPYIVKQLNESIDGVAIDLGGIALDIHADRFSRAQVGDLIAIRDADKPEMPWRLGAVRWMRLFYHGGGNLGVMFLMDQPKVVSVRAVEGTGVGGDFITALASSADFAQDGVKLIVPAALYDEGTILAVKSQDRKLRLRLVQQQEAADGFAMYLIKQL
ncbi:MAG: hypothetical protein AB1810_05155 [Pseudomonadota bacterium]